VLVGDRDGVVVVPRAWAAELAGPALEQERREAYLHTRIQAGEALWGVYPPSERTLADYANYRAAAGEQGGQGGGAGGAAPDRGGDAQATSGAR
jgi:hypothetical protein